MKQLGPTKEQKAMMKQMADVRAGGNPMEDFMIPPDQMVNLPPTPDRNYQLFWPIRKLIHYFCFRKPTVDYLFACLLCAICCSGHRRVSIVTLFEKSMQFDRTNPL